MASDFIDLDRSFIPVKEGEEPSLELTAEQGHRFGGWLDWKALLTHQRVVLLAEAGCGKTTEFEHQAEVLLKAGQVAFFSRVEQLEDGIEKALGIQKAAKFQAWIGSDQPGYFFLDSLDEARLSRRRFDDALRQLADDIGDDALSRAYIFISCRPLDWRGDNDRITFEKWLPAPKPATAPTAPSPLPSWAANRDMPAWKIALLAALDEGNEPQKKREKKQDDDKKTPFGPLVVNLAPLGAHQQLTFVQRSGIHNVDSFMECLRSKQLEPLAERPRDLRSLLDHWKRHGDLDNLSKMLEEAINLRLREINPERRSHDKLSVDKARQGAERLAAGLVLNHGFTLQAPDLDGGEPQDTDSLDATALLPDWSSADCTNLLTRGLFVPATYGRIRLFHRLAQEYLTACWLSRLLQTPGNRTAVHGLLFTERYGVRTSVPALRPVAAWLALKDSQVRAELMKRAPLALIQHGDPAALPLEDRAELLRIAAGLHKDGQIADDGIERSNLALFANPTLAPVIREIWQSEPRQRFRFILLRLIREAAISECADIARAEALDDATDQNNRRVAIEALSSCDDPIIIEEVLRLLLEKAENLPAQVATTIAECLFPKHMSLEQLLKLIEDSKASNGVNGNFEYILSNLFNACPDLAMRLKLAEGICQLCCAPPLVDAYYRVGTKHRELAQRLSPIARNLIKELEGQYHPALSAVMRVIQRCPQQGTIHDEKPVISIGSVLSNYPDLKQILFWEAATELAEKCGPGHEPTAILQLAQPFEIGPRDLEHFLHAATSKPEEWQKRLALDAAVYILKVSGTLRLHASRLLSIFADHPDLKAELIQHLFPRSPKGHFRKMAEHVVRRDRDESRRKSQRFAWWIKFRDELSANPEKLRDPAELSGWRQGTVRLWNLTKWLTLHTREVTEAAVLAWPTLSAAFGQPVADAYASGMSTLWQSNEPKRPDENGRDEITCMGYAAIGIEAKDNPAWWATRLTAAHADRAASYACLSGKCCPFWFDALLTVYPAAVGPVLVREIEQEMRSTTDTDRHFLRHYASGSRQPPAIVISTIVSCLETAEPATLSAYDHALAILKAPSASLPDKEAFFLSTMDRLKRCTNDLIALRHLALLFTLAPDNTIGLMEQWINEATDKAPERATLLFRKVFNPRRVRIPTAPLSTLSTTGLEVLLRLAYYWLRSKAANVNEDADDVARDFEQSARNRVLKVLFFRPGPEARGALLRVGNTLPPANQLRFMELALEMAERDSNPPPWQPSQIIAFEQKTLLPVCNGEELLAVITGILEDIQHLLDNNDASPRAALRDCQDEDGVQRWLAYELTQRAHGRFSVTQETVTDRPNRMDILVQAATVPDQLVIEVKHGGKEWTAKQLLGALEKQLGEGYLLPDTRRHGILVVTNHGPRRWTHPVSKIRLPFSELLTLLQDRADKLTRAQGYARTLKAFGLDAAPDDPGAASKRGSARPTVRPSLAEGRQTQDQVRFTIRNLSLLTFRCVTPPKNSDLVPAP